MTLNCVRSLGLSNGAMRVAKLLCCAQADNFDGLIYDVPPEPVRKPFGRAANKVRTALIDDIRNVRPRWCTNLHGRAANKARAVVAWGSPAVG